MGVFGEIFFGEITKRIFFFSFLLFLLRGVWGIFLSFLSFSFFYCGKRNGKGSGQLHI